MPYLPRDDMYILFSICSSDTSYGEYNNSANPKKPSTHAIKRF